MNTEPENPIEEVIRLSLGCASQVAAAAVYLALLVLLVRYCLWPLTSSIFGL